MIGVVKRRPENLKNTVIIHSNDLFASNTYDIFSETQTIPTGGIEVHVEEILRVHKTFRGIRNRDNFGNNKRNYSTMGGGASQRNEPIVTAMTSSEYKRAGNSETIINWFTNREHTCGSLRLRDASKVVSLVGWIDKKTSKFIHLYDGYGHTQVIIDNDDVKNVISETTDSDILLVTGRVVGRPQSHVTHSSNTGEIELFADHIRVINPTEEYDGPLRKMPTEEALEKEDVEATGKELDRQRPPSPPATEPNVNGFTYRTHNCGELRDTHVGRNVTLCGWLEFSRMNKFFTLRDGYGHVQIIIPPEVCIIICIHARRKLYIYILF